MYLYSCNLPPTPQLLTFAFYIYLWHPTNRMFTTRGDNDIELSAGGQSKRVRKTPRPGGTPLPPWGIRFATRKKKNYEYPYLYTSSVWYAMFFFFNKKSLHTVQRKCTSTSPRPAFLIQRSRYTAVSRHRLHDRRLMLAPHCTHHQQGLAGRAPERFLTESGTLDSLPHPLVNLVGRVQVPSQPAFLT